MTAPEDADFIFVDEVPETGNPVAVGGLECETCGKPLTYGGRGRKPRFCDEHKRNATARTGGRGKSAVVDRAIVELRVLYGVAGKGLSYWDRGAGELVIDNSDKLAESYRLLLETNDKFRKLFADIENKAAWLPILMVHGDLIAAIMIRRAFEKTIKAQEAKEAETQEESSPDNVWPLRV